MKQNYLLIVAILILFNGNVVAQEEKQTIAIAPFSYVKGAISDSDLKRVEARVEKVINELRRFIVVNRQDMVALDSEREATKSMDFIDGRYIEQGKKLGAQLMVFGRVNSLTNKLQGKDNSNNYIADINVTIRIVDVSNTSELGNTTIEASSGKNASQVTGAAKVGTKIIDRIVGTNTKDAANTTSDVISRTAEQAISKAIENIDDDLRPFLIETFPAMFTIVQIIDKKDDKAKSVLIAAGKNAGIKSKDKISVVELVEMPVEGRVFIRKVNIAELEVSKVEDENFSQCTVTSGGTELNKKLEGKARLKAITYTKKN